LDKPLSTHPASFRILPPDLFIAVKEDPGMADTTTTENPAGKIPGWLKAAFGTLAGLMSGAFMMYLSPLLDKVVKPAKPVANFAVDLQGLKVQFHNRSSTKADGWWDFGDGAPLEPLVAAQESVLHTYTKPGTYTVKLTLRNILNEESERSVTINLDSGPSNEPPAILSLDAVPISPGSYAPATYRLITKTKNVSLCVWDIDEDRPLEFVSDPPADQDRLVTFNHPGGYVVKLAAVNGKHAAEKSVIVQVMEPPPGTVTAWVHVCETMTHVEKTDRSVMLTETFTAPTGDIQAIYRTIPARQGYEITAAQPVATNSSKLHNLQMNVSPDRQAVILTGELLKEEGGLTQTNLPQSPVPIAIHLSEERKTLLACPTVPATATLTVPGSSVLTLPTTPCNCTDRKRQFHFELRDGDHVIWQGSQLPTNALVSIGNRHYVLTATPIGDQVRIDLQDWKPNSRVSVN
jgi:PKD repeat protein